LTAAIKNSAEKDAGRDFAKTLSSLLEDDMNFEGNGNDEMLNTLVLEIKNTMTNLLASMSNISDEHDRHLYDHHDRHLHEDYHDLVDRLLDDEMMLDTGMTSFKDILKEVAMALVDNGNDLEVFLTSQAATVRAAMASYSLEQGSTSDGNAENRVETLAEEGANPLLLLLLIIILAPLFIVYTIITTLLGILFFPVLVLFYFYIECGGGNIHATGGGNLCDIFDKQHDNDKESDSIKHDADGRMF
jgi:hypothetical protein